jgi:hypothetical protein
VEDGGYRHIEVVVMAEETLNLLVQYGLAGVVIYLLFRIVFNDLASIKLELQQIREELKRIREVLENR